MLYLNSLSRIKSLPLRPVQLVFSALTSSALGNTFESDFIILYPPIFNYIICNFIYSKHIFNIDMLQPINTNVFYYFPY